MIIAWEEGDPENPYNWSNTRKSIIMLTTMMTILNSTMGSSLPSMAIPFIVREFGVTSTTQKVLPISFYLIGYVLGPMVWGPLSEQYGRRDITIATFVPFSLFTMACALATSWPAFLIFRLLCGAFVSAPIVIVTGIFADIYNDPKTRGRGMAIFMVVS
jgi:MFS family permease